MNIVANIIAAPFRFVGFLIKSIIKGLFLTFKLLVKLSIVLLYFGALAIPFWFFITGKIQTFEAIIACIMFVLLVKIVSKVIHIVFFKKRVTTQLSTIQTATV